MSSGLFETPPLALWRSVEEMMSSSPAPGWGTWQELMMTAKHPWAVYWASAVVPDNWHIMEPDEDLKSSLWVAQCVSNVNNTTLKPVDLVQCTVHVRGREKHVGGSFYVEPGQAPLPSIGLGKGPLMKFLLRLLGGLNKSRSNDKVLHVLGLLCQLAVPTFGLRQLQQLQQQLGVLELEFDVKVLMIHVMGESARAALLQDNGGGGGGGGGGAKLSCRDFILLVVLRNWLYHVSVLYKVAVRLSRLGFARPMDQLTGVALTVLGVVIGLWQTVGFAVLDLCIDALLVKAAICGLGRSATAAWLLWQVTIPWCGLEARLGSKAYSLARQSWTDIKNLVLNPQVLLNQQVGGVIKQLRPPVAVIGPWPAPLAIPEAIDDLSNADVPRGFICPITQSIMRQPALLLHDGTVTPSTYDKEAIQQWLASHRCRGQKVNVPLAVAPVVHEELVSIKSPGTQLRMKSVKLVYNGDLARSIEDWVRDKAQVGRQDSGVLGGAGGCRVPGSRSQGRKQVPALAGEQFTTYQLHLSVAKEALSRGWQRNFHRLAGIHWDLRHGSGLLPNETQIQLRPLWNHTYHLPMAQLQRSLVYVGPNHRLRRVIRGLQQGRTVKVGVIGGSISHGAKASKIGETDWFSLVGQFLRSSYPQAKVDLRNGCLPATPSALMDMCLEQSIDQDVDLLFIEYVANDGANSGWQFIDEGGPGKRKWGFISTTPGSVLTIKLDTRRSSTAQSGQPGRMNVMLSYLKSYVNMGQAVAICKSGCSCQPQQADGHHTLRQSTVFLVRLLPTESPDCIIAVELLKNTTSGKHKFKVMMLR
eukprot:gene5681-5919_t